MIRKTLSFSDILLILVNLLPLWGVWFRGWDASEVFLVYCLESVIIGLYQVFKMWLVTLVKPTAEWTSTGGSTSHQSGYFFILFFLVHYGFFIMIQLGIFLQISAIKTEVGVSNPFTFLFHFPRYLSDTSMWLLLSFVISYGFITLKDFVLTGRYKTARTERIMLEPYMRIFVQQFTVILGSLFLGFGAGKIFMLIFVVAKIFFEILVPFDLLLKKQMKKETSNNTLG